MTGCGSVTNQHSSVVVSMDVIRNWSRYQVHGSINIQIIYDGKRTTKITTCCGGRVVSWMLITS